MPGIIRMLHMSNQLSLLSKVWIPAEFGRFSPDAVIIHFVFSRIVHYLFAGFF